LAVISEWIEDFILNVEFFILKDRPII